MTAVTNVHVYGTCLKIFGVMNIKIGCKKLKFRKGDNIERGSVMMCLFQHHVLHTLLPWADCTKEFALWEFEKGKIQD